MTPPKVSLRPPFSENSLELPYVFFPDLQLHLDKDTPLNLGLQNPSEKFHLGNFALTWSPPALWSPQGILQILPPMKPKAPPIENKTLTGAQTWALVENILFLMESLDARGTRMISNGGQGGCRYEEMAQRSEVEKIKDKCLVKFDPDTHADVDLQLRKKKGTDETLITQFRVTYDKSIIKDEWPDNNVRVLGFQFTPRSVKRIPFYEEIDPLTQAGYSLRYMVTPNGLLQIPFFGYPIFKGIAEPNDKLDLSRDFLAALGIEKPEYFKEAHTDTYKIPQLVRDFMQILHHIESDDDKLSVVNINKLKGRPKLFDWLSFEKIDWVAHLREGSLEIPNFGSFNFTRDKLQAKIAQTSDLDEQHRIQDQNSRFEIHGSQKELVASLINPEIKEARFSVGQHEVTLKGLTAGKITSTLPGLKKLIAKISDGKFSLEDLSIHAEDLHVDEITIYDSKNKIKTYLKNAHIQNFNFNGLSNISAEGVSADIFDIDSPKLSMGLHIESASIPKIHFGRSPQQDSLVISRIEGKNTELNYSNTRLKSETGAFENLRWIETEGKSQLKIQSLNSSGSFQYLANSGISFKTSGSSSLNNISLIYEKQSDEKANLSAQFDLSGLIQQLGITQENKISVQLGNTQFNPSHIRIDLSLDPSDNAVQGIAYDIDLKLEKTELKESKLDPITLAPSSIRNGRIHLVQKNESDWKIPQIDVSGILDVHIQDVSGNNESFNIPGLSVTGGIHEIGIEGPAHFQTTPTGWFFEKLATDNNDKLHAKAKIKGVSLVHDPHQVPGNTLRTWLHNQVVKTDMQFRTADFSIDDIVKIEFVGGKESGVSENRLRNIELHNIRFENIQAAGVAWAKFPLFYYMRGLFPQIGTRHQDSITSPSFVSLDRFSILTPPEGKAVTTFEGFKTEIYEIGGEEKFAKVNIPLLKISPGGENLVDTGNNPNEIELYLIDKPRGGYIRLHSVPRPLEKRNSRVVTPKVVP